MQHNYNYSPAQLFQQVLASTATLTSNDQDKLQTLLYNFPQCGVLQAIQARSGNADHLGQAAARFADNVILKKVVYQPDSLPAVNAAQIIYQIADAVPEINEPADSTVADELTTHSEAEQTIDTPGVVFDSPTTADAATAEPLLMTGPASVENVVAETQAAEPEPHETNRKPANETQQLIMESIAANDYFVFDRKFVEPAKPEEQPVPQPPITLAIPASEPAVVADESQVTRYHDEQLPYSFLWWLDKTRQKHSSVYQPYAQTGAPGTKAAATVADEIAEPEDDKKKEEEIVDRFIQQQPHIKPPSGDKLDSENKAKQSAEDQQELITETLARIYADQMLYAKAIAAYKILMLKNPEKRRYFASQIELLEKKIN